MFKITIADAEMFQKQIRIISDIISEGRIRIKKDGFGLVAMDPSNVALVNYVMLPSACAEYTVDNEDELTINFTNFHTCIKTASKSSIITLSKDKNQIVIRIKGETQRTFKLPMIDYGEKDATVPKLKHSCKVTMNSAMLKKEVEAADIVAESVTFECKKDNFQMYAEGDQAEVSIQKFLDMESEGEAVSKYSVEYLKKINEAAGIADKVEIGYSTDQPAEFRFQEPDKFRMEFILAPRVTNE